MNAVQPPAMLLSQKMLSDVVSEALPQYTSGADLLPKNIISVGNHDLQLSGEPLDFSFSAHYALTTCEIELF